jgi:hypothetical protein
MAVFLSQNTSSPLLKTSIFHFPIAKTPKIISPILTLNLTPHATQNGKYPNLTILFPFSLAYLKT